MGGGGDTWGGGQERTAHNHSTGKRRQGRAAELRRDLALTITRHGMR